MLRHQRSAGSDDQGYSLIELIVVIGILGIVGTVVMSATISGLQASRRAQARVEALNDLTLGLERIGRELRAANPIDLTVITTLDDVDQRVAAWIERDGRDWRYHYYLADGADGVPELREDLDVYNADGTYNTTLSHDNVFIVKTVNVDENTPLVTYIDSNGDEITCDGLDVTECRAALAGAAQLRLTLIRSLDEGEPVTAQTLVSVRYARYS